MRILYFYQYFSTPKGSWGTRAYEFARRWVDSGDQVTVVTSVYDKSDLETSGLLTALDVDGIQVAVINVRLSNKHNVLARMVSFTAFTVIASWLAVTRQADVVIASSGPISVGLLGFMAKYVRGRRFVFEMRDIFSEGVRQMGIVTNPVALRVLEWLETSLCRSADLVITLSPGMADWVNARGKGTPVVVVPNAADNALFGREETFQRSAEELRQPTAVFTGTVGSANNCGLLLDSARVLLNRGEKDIVIEIIGDGGEKARLEARVARESLRNIHFRGLMPKRDLANELRRAALALLVLRPIPVFDTVSPNKLFDALAAGLPVVQTTQGWIKDLLEKERCGLTVCGDDPEAMADAIVKIVRDPELRAEMGTNARRVALEQFDRDLLADKMRQVLLEAAGGDR